MGTLDARNILTEARADPDIVRLPARKALIIEGSGAPEGDDFRRAIQAIYGVFYTMKFARKRAGGRALPAALLEGDWWVTPADGPVARTARDRWHWRLRIMVPDDVTASEVRRAVTAATTKKGGALEGADVPKRVTVEKMPAHRVARILHVGPYANEPETFARLESFLSAQHLRRQPWHTEVYLSDPRRSAPEKLKTTLLVDVARSET